MNVESAFVHDVLLFGSDEELLASTVPFVAHGIVAGDLIFVLGPGHDVDVLRTAFDDDPRVIFASHTERYLRPAATIGEYQRLCLKETAAGRRVRVTGPVPFGEDPAVRLEWMRYEALVDRVLGPYQFIGMCRYDTRTTTPEILDLALAAHRRIGTAAGPQSNDRCLPPGKLLHDLAPRAGPHALQAWPAVWVEPNCAVVATVRHAVGRVLTASGMALEGVDDFVAAVNEVVSNAIEHGGPPVQVRLHTDGERWLCVVTDNGPGIRDPWTGLDGPLASQAGLGLAIARQLCDALTISPADPHGTTVMLVLDGRR